MERAVLKNGSCIPAETTVALKTKGMTLVLAGKVDQITSKDSFNFKILIL